MLKTKLISSSSADSVRDFEDDINSAIRSLVQANCEITDIQPLHHGSSDLVMITYKNSHTLAEEEAEIACKAKEKQAYEDAHSGLVWFGKEDD